MTQERKRQHHVWRKYLEAWCIGDSLFCKNKDSKSPFPNIPKNLAVGRCFYRINKLSERDLTVIESVIDKFSENQRNFIRSQIHNIMAPILRWQVTPNLQYKEKINIYKTNALEDWHTNIEKSFLPFLADMQCGELGFLKHDSGEKAFYNFVATQYLRTRKVKLALIKGMKPNFPDTPFDNIAGLLVAATALNFGANLFCERRERIILRLEAPKGHSFLTSDSPLVNIAHLWNYPEGVCIFYPVSPRFALLISDANIIHGLDGVLKSSEMSSLNAEIMAAAEFQTFAMTSEELTAIQ